jgi:hypothetical protein
MAIEAYDYKPHPREAMGDSVGEPLEAQDGQLSKVIGHVADVGAAAIVLAEVTPANEALRLSIAGVAEAALHSPFATTAAFAAATLAIEGGAAVATARLLENETAGRAVDWLHDKAAKVGIGGEDGYKTGALSDLTIGTVGGSAVAVFAKHVQDPDRTFAQNARFGVLNSAAVTAVASPVVYGFTRLAETVGWENVGIGAAVAAGAIGLKGWIGSRFKRLANFLQDAPEPTVNAFNKIEKPEYFVDDETIARTEAELVAMVRQDVGRKACAVWLRGDTVAANVIRTLEAKQFPEVPELMRNDDDSVRFLAVVDARPSAGEGRIIRATRLSSPLFNDKPDERDPIHDLAIIRGMVSSGQITEQEIVDYYQEHRFDLDDTVSVETNFRIGERAQRLRGIPMSQIAYSTIVKFAVRTTRPGALTTIVAHVNSATKASLSRLGIKHEAFAGRSDLRTPDELGGYDEKYEPVVYTYEGRTKHAFQWLARYASIPEIEV